MDHTLPLAARLPSRRIFEDDWRARPTPEHPFSVVLIHGTGVTKGDWMELGEDLRTLGYAVFAPDFGYRSTTLVEESTAQVAAYLDVVLQITGAQKLILVGHSQGGIIARRWLHHLGGAQYTHQLVCLGVPNHGTTHGGVMSPLGKSKRGGAVLDTLIQGFFGQSGFQMLNDSDIITALNARGETCKGVHYSCITTLSDRIIQPVESCFLLGANNLYVQDMDSKIFVSHEDLPHHPLVREMVVDEIVAAEPQLPHEA
ncbi:esterase/lipase family protein [Corynebacterium gerontici]|nr:triacylglycerol lipase [Corynebacterium gerontici]